MSDPSIPVPRVPGEAHPGRRPLTTVWGTVTLVLGSLGLISSVWSIVVLWAMAFGGDSQVFGDVVPFVGSLITAVLTKLGLIAVGILILRRHTLAFPATFATCVLSLTSSVLQVAHSAQAILAAADGAVPTSVYLFPHCIGFVSVLVVYGATLVFLRHPATRAEFEHRESPAIDA